MNAIKQRQSAGSLDHAVRNSKDDLTQQERRALSLIWRDDDGRQLKAKGDDPAVEHCAELGYN